MKLSLTLGLIFLFLSLNNSLTAQSIEELDRRHGFKDIKIGADYWDWNDKMESKGKWPGGRPRFHYVGNKNYKVFNLGIEDISFEIVDFKIATIVISTEFFHKADDSKPDLNLDDFQNLVSNFEYLFGKGEPHIEDRNSAKISYFWFGEEVTLTAKFDYHGVSKGSRAVIILTDAEYQRQKLEDGF